MSKEDVLSLDRLREVLSYNGRTGEWRWLRQTGPRTMVGTLAGTVDRRGYRHIKIDGFAYRSSRLARFYVTGEWPPLCMDHADQNKSNDHWSNLRAASHAQNIVNRPTTSELGVRGVYRQVNSKVRPFIAKISIDNRETYLGSFPTIEAASAVYNAAARKQFGEFVMGAEE